jgi:hypothetical protein
MFECVCGTWLHTISLKMEKVHTTLLMYLEKTTMCINNFHLYVQRLNKHNLRIGKKNVQMSVLKWLAKVLMGNFLIYLCSYFNKV